MSNAVVCQSCGMPMETVEDHAPHHPESTWCRFCSTDEGDLQAFEERFQRMTQWSMHKQGLERSAAEVATRAYMRAMPAWRDNPALRDQ